MAGVGVLLQFTAPLQTLNSTEMKSIYMMGTNNSTGKVSEVQYGSQGIPTQTVQVLTVEYSQAGCLLEKVTDKLLARQSMLSHAWGAKLRKELRIITL